MNWLAAILSLFRSFLLDGTVLSSTGGSSPYAPPEPPAVEQGGSGLDPWG